MRHLTHQTDARYRSRDKAGDPIGSVIKHLGDDLAQRSRFGRALHLHENGDPVAIEK